MNSSHVSWSNGRSHIVSQMTVGFAVRPRRIGTMGCLRIVILGLALCATGLDAQPTTYAYIGSHFVNAPAPYTTSNFISGTMTTSSPLPPSCSFVVNINGYFESTCGPSVGPGVITAFSFSDGLETINSSNAKWWVFVVVTDGDGNIKAWDINFYTFPFGAPPNGYQMDLCNGCGVEVGDIIVCYVSSCNFAQANSDTAGTWTVKPINCNFKPSDVQPSPDFPNSLDGLPEIMRATFKPTDANNVPIGLLNAANACGFESFNWQQTVREDPWALLAHSTLAPSAPLFAPYADPPPCGYLSQESDPFLNNTPDAGYPFYFDLLAPSTYPLSLAHNQSLTPIRTGIPGDVCPPATCTILNFSDWPGDKHLQAGQYLKFSTSLVGVLSGGGSALCGRAESTYVPLYTWEWTSNFNGTFGGVAVHSVTNLSPADPGSGTGGVTITSINGAAQVPPRVNCAATPNTIWPPNGKPVVVTVLGTVTAGTQALAGTAYAVIDEYGQIQPNGSIALAQGGSYSFGVSLIAARNGDDKDGRTYTINVTASDAIGNVGSCSAVVTVPHDQGN